MNPVKRVVGHVLNINFIWGAMILVAFYLCVWQHYAPTTTIIPASDFHTGENRLTLRVPDASGEVQDFTYTLSEVDGEIALDPNDLVKRTDRPWLIEVRRADGNFALVWDTTFDGPFQAVLNDAEVGHGRLVNLQTLTNASFDYAESGFKLALGLVAAMVLFLGLMRIGQDAGIVQLVARVFYPVIRFLFPEVPKDHPANGAILMNWTTTVLGLGNAATPFGLKAMQELQSLNPNPKVASNAEVMLLGFNTAGFALLPTTLLAVRKAAGCSDPFEIIGTCMFAGAVSTITAITVVKILNKLPMFSVAAAVEEERRTAPAESTKGNPTNDDEQPKEGE